jgi:integrase/recombinase XerC
VQAHNKGKRYPQEALRRGEAERLMRAAANVNNYALLRQVDPKWLAARTSAIFTLMWRLGLRTHEVLGLRGCDIDLETRTLRVLLPKGAANGTKPRVLGMDVLATTAVKRWLRFRDPELDDGQPLFHTTKGNKIPGQIVRAQIKRLALYANLRYRRVHCHILRHTFAFEKVMEGRPLPWIQRALGHKTLLQTQEYCSHLAPADIIDDMKEMK